MSTTSTPSHCSAVEPRRCQSVEHGALAPLAIRMPERERDVLQLLAHGYRYEQIALHLAVSLSSVRTYIARAYRRLEVNTKSEAIARAMRAGILR